MLLVTKMVNYEERIGSLVRQHISFSDADKIAAMILGEPDPEPYDSLTLYIVIFINTLISVPLLSVLITMYNAVVAKVSLIHLPKEWALSSLRRLVKIFSFTFLFYVLFRFLPYQAIFPGNKTWPALTLTAIVGFNLLSTIVCYWLIKKIIPIKRSL
jgi:hypothetical protein